MVAPMSTFWPPPHTTSSPDPNFYRTPMLRSSSVATSTRHLRPSRTLVPNSRRSTLCSKWRSPRIPRTDSRGELTSHALAEQATPGSASSVAPTKPAPATRKAAPPAAEPARGSAVVAGAQKRWLPLAVAVAVVVLAGVVALAWHPWQSGRSTSTPTSSSQPPAAASASLPSSTAAPPPPPVPGTADSEPAGTEIITALAVDARGQPTNGYREAPAGSISELAGCDQPSPAPLARAFTAATPLRLQPMFVGHHRRHRCCA